MPPRNPELPEGTDHIVNGAMEINAGAGTATGGGGSSTGFVATGAENDTGGSAGGLRDQLKDNASSIRDQATTKVREYAVDGKTKATTALDDFSRVVSEAADSIDERLGSEYGQYARRAADAVSDLADNLRNKDVDELYDDARNLVRKSPAVAIGIAAAVGFALVRIAKAGMPSDDEGEFAAGRPGDGSGRSQATPPNVSTTGLDI